MLTSLQSAIVCQSQQPAELLLVPLRTYCLPVSHWLVGLTTELCHHTMQAYMLDLGHSRAITAPKQCEAEMEELRELFQRSSDENDMTGEIYPAQTCQD